MVPEVSLFCYFDILDFQGARTPHENERSSDDPGRKKHEARNRGDQSSCNPSRKSADKDSGDDCSQCSTDRLNCSHRNQDSESSSRAPKGSLKEKALRQLKLDMEENHFLYIHPRMNVRRRDYLHYTRRKKGVLIYAVHADYYILLRCCAKVALVETRIMHIAVLRLEKRLQWLEKRIDLSLNLLSNLGSGCDLCEGDVRDAGNDTIHSNN